MLSKTQPSLTRQRSSSSVRNSFTSATTNSNYTLSKMHSHGAITTSANASASGRSVAGTLNSTYSAYSGNYNGNNGNDDSNNNGGTTTNTTGTGFKRPVNKFDLLVETAPPVLYDAGGGPGRFNLNFDTLKQEQEVCLSTSIVVVMLTTTIDNTVWLGILRLSTIHP